MPSYVPLSSCGLSFHVEVFLVQRALLISLFTSWMRIRSIIGLVSLWGGNNLILLKPMESLSYLPALLESCYQILYQWLCTRTYFPRGKHCSWLEVWINVCSKISESPWWPHIKVTSSNSFLTIISQKAKKKKKLFRGHSDNIWQS
jgi:hypothetical protein